MRNFEKLIVGGAILALMSGTAFAGSDIRFGFSIGVPSVPVYVAPAPSYYPAPVYSAPPPGYYSAPRAGYYEAAPQMYYSDSAPAPVYYDSAPGFSVYYGPSYREYRQRRDWHHERDRTDDDD